MNLNKMRNSRRGIPEMGCMGEEERVVWKDTLLFLVNFHLIIPSCLSCHPHSPLQPPKLSMDIGNPFVTSNERLDVISKLKRHLIAMLEDQSPSSLMNTASRINDVAVRFEESVWRATNGRKEYFGTIQTKLQSLQQQRSTISANAVISEGAKNSDNSQTSQGSSTTPAASSSAQQSRQVIQMLNQIKQSLPQLDTLLRTHSDILRESEQLRKILEMRTLAHRVLEMTAKSGTIPLTLQQANILCQQMNAAIQGLSGGRHSDDSQINRSTPTRKQANREAMELAELLVKEEVHDFEEDYPGRHPSITIECLPDHIQIVVGGDMAKLMVYPGYPAVPVDIKSDAVVAHTTVTNCLQYFESMMGGE